LFLVVVGIVTANPGPSFLTFYTQQVDDRGFWSSGWAESENTVFSKLQAHYKKK
jgi:hypothetical protein